MLRLESLEDRCLLSANTPDWDALDGLPMDSVAATIAASKFQAESPVAAAQSKFAAVYEGEWIVRYAGSRDQRGAAETEPGTILLKAARQAGVQATLSHLSASEFGLFSAPKAADTDVVGWAAQDPTITTVSPNFVYQLHLLPNDPALDFDHPDHVWTEILWGLKNEGEPGLVVGSYAPDSIQAGTADVDVDAPEAWDLTTGSDQVVLAVVDTGIDYNHPDLAGNIWHNLRDPPGDVDHDGNPDDDGNGFVDDVHGWDFVGDDIRHPVHDNDPADPLGHGTHVAGIMGAVGNNGEGVVGVNWNVRVLPLKIADQRGGMSTASAIEALDYLVQLKNSGVNVAAANASWGNSFGITDVALDQALGRLNESGVLFVASAGNDSHYRAGYPASSMQPNVVSVAALNRTDQLAFFSNYNQTEIDLAAPGDAILSTFLAGEYKVLSGTSMAAPYVTGVAGLLAAVASPNQPATVHSIKDALYEGVVLNSDLTDKVATGGSLNAVNSLQAFLHDGPIVRDLSVARTSLSTNQVAVDVSQPLRDDCLSSDNAYLLAAGLDGILGSSDDVLWNPIEVSLESPLRARLLFSEALGIGWQRLILEADGVDLQGNPVTPVQSVGGIPVYDGTDFVWDFEVIPVPGAFEPNDWLSLATDTGVRGHGTFDTRTMAPGPKIGDGLNPASDIDLFSFALGERSVVHASVTARATSKLDPLLRLFDGDGNELLMIDDMLGTESSLTVALDEPGTYYVGISASANSTYDPHVASEIHNQTSGSYDLTLDVASAPLQGRSVQGAVFHDLSVDAGCEDLREPPLIGWTVFVDLNDNGVYDAEDLSTQTMSGGRYDVDGLAPGIYRVGMVLQPGWEATTDPLQVVDLRTTQSSLVDFAARRDTSQSDSWVVTEAADRLSQVALSQSNVAVGLSLREAIQFVEWYPELSTIWIGAEVPRLTTTKGQFQIENTELVIRGNDPLVRTVLDGNRQDRIFYVAPHAALILYDIELTGGHAPRVTMPASLSETQGGALFNAGTVVLQNVLVRENEAGEDGGGLFNSYDAVMTLHNTRVAENVARSLRSQRISLPLRFNGGLVPFTFTTGGGGGIANHGELHLNEASQVEHNVSEREGGGIYVGKSGTLKASQASIVSNVAVAGGGGGIFAYAHGTETGTPQLLQFHDTIVALNSAHAPRLCSCFIIARGSGGGIVATEFDESVDWTYAVSVGLVGSTIANNTTYEDGGGVRFITSQVDLKNTTVQGNSIDKGNGGGLHVTALRTLLDQVKIADNVVAPFGHGGGIYYDASGPLEIENSEITANRLERDPALANGGGGQGGGIYTGSGTIVIRGSLVDANVSVADGGGIRNRGGNLTVLNSTVSNNSTQLNFNNLWGRGGGISSGVNLDEGSSRIVVVNSTISQNISAGKGGGVTLKHSDLPTEGGAGKVANPPAVVNHSGVIHNSIIAGNFQANGQQPISDDADGPGWDRESSHNVFGVLLASSPLAVGVGTLAGSFSVPLIARLQPLTDHGGPTRTYALLPTSPAIDRGSAEIAKSFELSRDQRGFSRVLDGNGDGLAWIDVGAYEWLYGDLDGNGGLSATDIDFLCQHFGQSDYDLNGNGLTDFGDMDTLIHDILQTEYGDANLDHVVDGQDFVLWNGGKFQAGGWGQGDFNGDGYVDGEDLQIWLNHFGWSETGVVGLPTLLTINPWWRKA